MKNLYCDVIGQIGFRHEADGPFVVLRSIDQSRFWKSCILALIVSLGSVSSGSMKEVNELLWLVQNFERCGGCDRSGGCSGDRDGSSGEKANSGRVGTLITSARFFRIVSNKAAIRLRGAGSIAGAPR